MSRVRYLKSLEQLKQEREARRQREGQLESRVSSLRFVYETDPAIARALVPRPLEPAARPEVCVTLSKVAIRISPEYTHEIGSAVFGVRARHGDTEGIALITMPMTTEQAVLGGRDTFGEPKKLANIQFELDEATGRVHSTVERLGMTYLRGSGRLGASLGPRQHVEHAFCFKVSPSPSPERDFDSEPLLVRLDWRHDQDRVHVLEDAELVLGESPFDPVADVPVRRLLTAEYEEGRTDSDGRVLESVPAEWVLPILHQRYDEPGLQGVEIAAS